MGFMVVRAEETKRIFLDEIAVLLIENPAVSLTGCLLEALVQEVADSGGDTLERILDYMELVRELDRDKLFIMINMRSYFSDEDMERFVNTACLHDFKLLLLESISHKRLKNTKRYTVDDYLCEF